MSEIDEYEEDQENEEDEEGKEKTGFGDDEDEEEGEEGEDGEDGVVEKKELEWEPCACSCDGACCEACCCPCLTMGRIFSVFDDDYAEERYVPQALAGVGCLVRWWICCGTCCENAARVRIPKDIRKLMMNAAQPGTIFCLTFGILFGRVKHRKRYGLPGDPVAIVIECVLASICCHCYLLTQEERTIENIKFQRLEKEAQEQMAQMVGELVGAGEDAIMDAGEYVEGVAFGAAAQLEGWVPQDETGEPEDGYNDESAEQVEGENSCEAQGDVLETGAGDDFEAEAQDGGDNGCEAQGESLENGAGDDVQGEGGKS